MNSSIEAAESSPAENLLSNYSPPPGSYDELLDDRGQIRESWRQFAAGLEAMGPQGLSQRYEQARRLLRENGIVQGGAGFPHGTDRHWELDPLPLLLAKSEWDSLAAALAQRVQLLNLILADLYGPQNLVREALIPPELVFGQRGFLLPCHGVAPPRNIFLHLYAGHLVRGADGCWSVYADYTQGPPGAGLALENRIVTSRILPTDFHSLHVERLAGFFITLRDTLQSLSATAVRQSPRRAPLARTAKSKLLRGCLPRPLSRLYARRRRRPDGPRHERLLEDPRRPVARRCHSPPHARRGSRSAGVALRLDVRRGRTGAGRAERAGRRGQRPGQRTLGIARADGLPAGHLPPVDWAKT